MSSRAEPFALDAALLQSWPMPVDEGGDKFVRGTALAVGGSPNTPGAVRLAGEAALRMGAGRLQVVTSPAVAVTLAVAMPEALVAPLDGTGMDTSCWCPDPALAKMLREANAVLIGSGMSGEASAAVVVGALQHIGPGALVVLDALALQCLSIVPDELVPRGRLVLTPNRQELRALAGHDDHSDDDGALDEAAFAASVAARYGAVVTCFGRVTAPDRCWITGEGSPGLGTSGSGDVLAGLALGAAARCGDPAQAACWATFAHARAASSLAERVGKLSFLARELLAEVPAVLGAVEP